MQSAAAEREHFLIWTESRWRLLSSSGVHMSFRSRMPLRKSLPKRARVFVMIAQSLSRCIPVHHCLAAGYCLFATLR